MGYKSIGKRIQLAREEAGLSQEQLSTKIGCSQSALSNYEKGKRRIYLAQLEKIAETLNKTIQFFLQPLEKNNFMHQPSVSDTDPELLTLFQSLSPEGQKLLVNFAVWLKKREVGEND